MDVVSLKQLKCSTLMCILHATNPCFHTTFKQPSMMYDDVLLFISFYYIMCNGWLGAF